MSYEYQNFLAHYGIKGQKHGHRRYQNPDGSLTPEGREHYGVGERRVGAPQENQNESENSNRDRERERERRRRRIIIGASTVLAAAALAYGGFRAATFIRNEARSKLLRKAMVRMVPERNTFDREFNRQIMGAVRRDSAKITRRSAIRDMLRRRR